MRIMARPSISTSTPEMMGSFLLGTPGLVSGWPAANDALFLPVTLNRPALVQRLFCVNGSTVGGNVDMGLYSVDGKLIVAIGSTAQAGASVPQFFNIADTYLAPGRYYLAAAKNDTSRIARYSITVGRLQLYGVLKIATAFPLPATATFATVTAAYLPLLGMELMRVL